jgi:hypothetical protein
VMRLSLNSVLSCIAIDLGEMEGDQVGVTSCSKLPAFP